MSMFDFCSGFYDETVKADFDKLCDNALYNNVRNEPICNPIDWKKVAYVIAMKIRAGTHYKQVKSFMEKTDEFY